MIRFGSTNNMFTIICATDQRTRNWIQRKHKAEIYKCFTSSAFIQGEPNRNYRHGESEKYYACDLVVALSLWDAGPQSNTSSLAILALAPNTLQNNNTVNNVIQYLFACNPTSLWLGGLALSIWMEHPSLRKGFTPPPPPRGRPPCLKVVSFYWLKIGAPYFFQFLIKNGARDSFILAECSFPTWYQTFTMID